MKNTVDKWDDFANSGWMSQWQPALLLLAFVATLNSFGTIAQVEAGVIVQEDESRGEGAVRLWEEPLTLPTYRVDPPDHNPMFFRNEVYQGAKKKVYPYPLQDKVTRILETKTYTAVHLENEYVALTVLPELGGRLFTATDKTNNYDFFYRQNVVKPALIGMLGAWISGGIEWCVFHHHRNTTFMPVDYTLEAHADGSKTVWVGETERRHRMRWIIGLTLYPGRSYIEATVKLFNRTAQAHSILYWANVAVHASDDYEVLFPPSVQVATYHSKNEFIHWPVGQGAYQGIDYEGVDLSRWPNHPEPTSFFAWNLAEDFSGGYDHGKAAGVVHVGNHHIMTGTKLWEWGPGPRGRLWDQILTDEDGPYAELMVGGLSDNQPDYSWIKPHEVKTFTHHWYPVQEIGGFTKANLEAAVNLEVSSESVQLGFNSTTHVKDARVSLVAKTRTLLDSRIVIGPGVPFTATVDLPLGVKATDVEVTLFDAEDRVLISDRPRQAVALPELPDPVEPPVAPEEITTVDELYLTGLRLQQGHSPVIPPEPYYEEALRRDPNDVRVNTIVGTNLNKRGLFQDAERYLRTALKRLTSGYVRLGDTEAEYQLGLALRGQGRFGEAYEQFYRASWDAAFHSVAFYHLAELSMREGEWDRALNEIKQSLSTNTNDTKSLGIEAVVLRKLGRIDEALVATSRALAIDPMDTLALNERLLTLRVANANVEAATALDVLTRTLRDDAQTYLELATDYGNVMLWGEAIKVLERLVEREAIFASSYPMVHYYLGYFHGQSDDKAEAITSYQRAAGMPAEYGFPFRLESIEVLEAALSAQPDDHRAHYYLGNLLYEIQPELAISHWEQSRDLFNGFSTSYRNLGWAYYRTRGNLTAAIESYERAVALDRYDTRLYVELDELYQAANVPIDTRLRMVSVNHEVLERRSDSLLRALMVQVLAGDYETAIRTLEANQFFVAEGGGRVHGVFVDAHLLRGLTRLKGGQAREALADFERAAEYPENLSVARPRNDRRASQVAYYTALAHHALGETERASEYFRRAADQPGTERWPDTWTYQALSLERLGYADEAREKLESVLNAAEIQLAETRDDVDFFAKFGSRASEATLRARALSMLGFAQQALGRTEEARTSFGRAVELDVSQLWAQYYLISLP